MTDRYQRLIKLVAIGNDEHISMYERGDTWFVYNAHTWVQPCHSLTTAEAHFAELIDKHAKRIALHALGIPDD